MATIELRSGAWRVRIIRRRLGIDESATFPKKSQAAEWATAREAEILAGVRGLPTKHTLADAIDRFIREVCPNRKGARWEELRLKKFRRDNPKMALRPVSSLTSEDMARWRDGRLKEVSPSSVGREMNLLGALFSIALREWKWVNGNACKGVKRPAQPLPRRRGINAVEVDAILKNLNGVSGAEVRHAFLLALETGMRAGEILGLTWDHVDLESRVVTLPKTKNGDSRQVPLSKAAVNMLRGLLPQDSALAPIGGNEPIGKPFTITGPTLDVLFRRARDAAVKDCPSCATVRFHDSRSEAITRLSRKLDVLELARVVGHRDINSLRFYYAKSAAEIAKKLD